MLETTKKLSRIAIVDMILHTTRFTVDEEVAEEIAKQGYYDLPHYGGYNWTDDPQYLEREHNPYIDAFWKWFPDAIGHLHTLRITGGEPLMSKHTFALMEMLINNPNPELELLDVLQLRNDA